MITLQDALALVTNAARPLPPEKTSLDEALGLVLAEDVASDVDSPPHDKAMVDGYALQSDDLAEGPAVLRVLEEVTAGRLPTRTVTPGAATRIMTGAPLPKGADAVVMVEQTSAEPNDRVRIDESPIRPGQHIMRRGTSMRRGDLVLTSGATIRQIEAGLLAEVGQASVLAIPRPHVAVLSTGDELVPLDQAPGPGMLRNSNGPLLAAAIRRAGGWPLELGIARDEQKELAERVGQGLRTADILLLSGGVSAGVLDLVPSVLTEAGVRQVFHKVRVKPGKPVWFGVCEAQIANAANAAGSQNKRTLVFGLPGNPVSGLVTFELLVRPAIAVLSGRGPVGLEETTGRLAGPFVQRGDRPTFHPGVLAGSPGEWTARPLVWRGSADLRTLAAADCWICFPEGDCEFSDGDEVKILRI